MSKRKAVKGHIGKRVREEAKKKIGVFVGGHVQEEVLRQVSGVAHVGTKIKELRAKQEHSQLEVSRNTGLSQSYLSRIENEEVSPSRDVLERLALFFQVAPRTLVKGTASEPVLDKISLADRYGYCPNIECPGTVYRFISAELAEWGDFTVKEFLSVQEGRLYGYTEDDRDLYSDYDGTTTLAEFRAKTKSLAVIYRWIELDENTNFCELCGTELQNSCPHPNCEVPLKNRNQKFCHGCGRELTKPPEHEEGGEE